jgi:hypothetical protein
MLNSASTKSALPQPDSFWFLRLQLHSSFADETEVATRFIRERQWASWD